MEHYFISKQHKDEDFFEFLWQFENREYTFKSCDDVFSKNQVDFGTYVLLKTIVKKINLKGDVLDIGCGYGVIGIVLANLYSDCNIFMSDVNKTAVQLAQYNAKKNGAKNIKQIVESNAYQNIDSTFDYIISNPPIKAGKAVLLDIVLGAFNKLNKGGSLVFVIKKKFGEDSLKKQLQTIFKSVEVLKRDSGYYVIMATK